MRRYELMLLLRPDLEDDKLQSAVEKVTRAIVNGGGSLSKVSPWGKRRLAYPIQHLREASYFLIHFDIEPGAVREIERSMLISEEILRHLVTVIEERGPAGDETEAAASPEPERTEDDAGTEAGPAANEPAPSEEPEKPGASDTEEPAAADESAAAEESAEEEEETSEEAGKPAPAEA